MGRYLVRIFAKNPFRGDVDATKKLSCQFGIFFIFIPLVSRRRPVLGRLIYWLKFGKIKHLSLKLHFVTESHMLTQQQ